MRILGGLAALAATLLGVLFAVYQVAYLPQELAAQQRAAAFATLRGPARRLAIYDAFAEQIDKHYYDQTFSGFDWPKLRREWRARAAAAPDDRRLYADVLFQVVQRFPASHITISPPNSPGAPGNGKARAGPCFDAGMQIVPFRRAQGVGLIVGEVSPGSPAARAGVMPGWSVETAQVDAAADGGRVKATLVRLDPAQMHKLETTGSVQLAGGAPTGRSSAANAALERLRQRVEFDYRCGPPAAPFETRRLPGGALYVRFDAFEAPILKKVEAALRTADPHGVVLDLRSNSGGQTIPGLSLLLPRGEPVYVERDAGGRHLRSTDIWTWRYRGPLVALIGPATASAAEITAAALERAHRAVLIGRRTNGSVLGARAFPLPDGGSVLLPVSDIEMLDGTRLEGAGVAPDIEIFPTAADLNAQKDTALERAERELATARVARR